jgi:hypothetical protein
MDSTLSPTQVDPHLTALLPDRPSLVRRASRRLARFLMTACIGVAATLAWQSYGGTAKQMIASWAPQLGWLPSVPAMNLPPSPEIAAEQPSPPAVQAPAPETAPAQTAAVARDAPETAPAASSSFELQQLKTIARDLAAVRQSIEQLTIGQQQTVRDIAKLQTAKQDSRQSISPPRPAAAPTRKPVPTSSQPAPQSSAVPLAPALLDSPSRSPMPVR